jgi:hypothetical protein
LTFPRCLGDRFFGKKAREPLRGASNFLPIEKTGWARGGKCQTHALDDAASGAEGRPWAESPRRGVPVGHGGRAASPFRDPGVGAVGGEPCRAHIPLDDRRWRWSMTFPKWKLQNCKVSVTSLRCLLRRRWQQTFERRLGGKPSRGPRFPPRTRPRAHVPAGWTSSLSSVRVVPSQMRVAIPSVRALSGARGTRRRSWRGIATA